jgi:hypothetical protein
MKVEFFTRVGDTFIEQAPGVDLRCVAQSKTKKNGTFVWLRNPNCDELSQKKLHQNCEKKCR